MRYAGIFLTLNLCYAMMISSKDQNKSKGDFCLLAIVSSEVKVTK